MEPSIFAPQVKAGKEKKAIDPAGQVTECPARRDNQSDRQFVHHEYELRVVRPGFS